jgi:molybdopterin converting factor small subunit
VLLMSTRAATATVPVEIASWITKFVGGDGSGRRVLEEPLTPGATVRSVLVAVSARFPELQQALWHGRELGEHIEVLVNDAVLGVEHDLDSPLRPGDRITLLAQFMGGV